MRTLFRTLIAIALGWLWGQAQTMPLYENYGLVNDDPPLQVDAIAFANYGTFEVIPQADLVDNPDFSVTPLRSLYDFSNTLYFTNRGSMLGVPGFRFDTVGSGSGGHRPAASFVNDSGGVIEGLILTVAATNVYNQGTLRVLSPQGRIAVQGQTVDLSRSVLDMATSAGAGSGDYVQGTNYFADDGIYDMYWGGPTNSDVLLNVTNFCTIDPVVGPIVITPPHSVTNVQNQVFQYQLGLVNPIVGVFTNRVSDSNFVVQAAFVGINTNLVSARVSFSRQGATPGNPYRVMDVQINMNRTNTVTGAIVQDSLYVADQMMANTNWNLTLTNTLTLVTYRPGNFRVSRVPFTADGFQFIGGSSGNGLLTTNLFYQSDFATAEVTNFYAGYIADVAALDAVSGQASAWGLSNSAGRLELDARNLNLEKTKMRANTLISVETDHLVSTLDSSMDSANYIFNLASTNGNLHLTEFTTDVVAYFGGGIYMWSGFWSNSLNVVTNEVVPDPNDPSLMITNTITNTVEIDYHAFVLDATSLGYTQQSSIQGLNLKSTNIVVDDNLNLVGPTVFDGQSLTLNGITRFRVGQAKFGSSNAPNALYFTNTGTFRVDNSVNLGADRSKPYASIVNLGEILTPGLVTRSDYFQNSGTIDAQGAIYLESVVTKLDGGYGFANGDITLVGGDLKLHRYTNSTPGSLYFVLTNSLADSGWGASSAFSCNKGFFMSRKPRYGDLLGTQLQTVAPGGSLVRHAWAAADRGATTDGFSNNVAIGRLVLAAGVGGVLVIQGANASGQYAIYADELDFQNSVLDAYNQNRLGDCLKIDPNLTIYYAYANVPVEELDGGLGGRFQWVRDFVGPNSGVEVLLPDSGKTIRVNRGLRESLTIDSDGDGYFNGQDTEPFSEPVVTAAVVRTGLAKAVISWIAAPLTTYQVEFNPDLSGRDWIPLAIVRNPETAPRVVEVQDDLPGDGGARYYRVRFNP